MSEFTNIIGLVGVIVTLIAYYGLQVGKMSNEAMSYSVMNIIGSILILVSLAYHWNMPSAIIELSWIVISILGVVRVVRTTQQTLTED